MNFKRIRKAVLSFTLMFALLLVSIPWVNAAGESGDRVYLLNENFDNTAIGQVPSGWTKPTGVNTLAAVDLDPLDPANKVIKISDNNASETAPINKKFDLQSNPVAFEWSLMEDNINSWTRYQVRSGSIIGIELITVSTAGEKVLNIANNYGVNVKVTPVESKKWYNIKVIADPQVNKYDVYVDGQLKISGVPFERTVTNLDNITFTTGRSYKNIVYIDNVRISNENAALVTTTDLQYNWQAPDLPEIQDAAISNPNIDKEHEITYDNYKGVTWGSAWNKWKLPDGTYDSRGIASDVQDLKYAGVHWVRVGIDNPGDSFAGTDQIVDAAANNGFKILALYKKKYAPKTYGTDEEEEKNAEHIKALVTRYKDRIKYWVVGNEANLDGENWDLGGYVGRGSDDPTTPYNVGVHEYALFLKNTYTAIKSADPNAVVILGGLSSGGFEVFCDRLKAEGAYNYFDEAAFHPYGKTPDDVIKLMDRFKSKTSTWPAPKNDIPIWVTEIGWHAEATWTNLSNMDAFNENVKAGYLILAMQKLTENMNIRRPIFWYNLHEGTRSVGFGLTQKYVQNDGSIFAKRLPAIEAMRSVNDHQHTTFSSYAPVTVAVIEPEVPDGKQGWYIHPVEVSLNADDDLSGIAETVYSFDSGATWLPYKGPITIDKDGIYTIQYRSKDNAGNKEIPKAISIDLDTTAPEIAFSGIQDGDIFDDAGDVTPVVVANDGMSGIDGSKTTVTLDTYGLQSGTKIPLYTLPIGTHSITVTASDQAGNTSFRTIRFETTTSVKALDALVQRFAEMKLIDNAGIIQSLRSQLAAGELAEFADHVKAQSNKHISSVAAGYLLRDAGYLLAGQD